MEHNSFVGLFQNISLLLAVALLFEVAVVRFKKSNTLLTQVVTAFALGGIGVVVMLTPWTLIPGVVFDTRSVLVGITGLFFGPLSTVIVVLMTSAFRLFQGGQGAWTGVSVIVASGVIGTVWRHFRGRQLHKMTWQELYLFGLVVHVVMLVLMLTLPWDVAMKVLSNIALPVILIYPVGTALLGSLLVNCLQRERTGKQLCENMERYRLLVDTANEGIWAMDREHVTTYVNAAMANMLGYRPDEIVGNKIENYFYQEDMKLHNQRMAQRHAGIDDVYERRFRRKDGAELWAMVSAKSLLDEKNNFQGSFAMLTDITLRKFAETALAKSELLLRTIKNSIPDLVWLKDVDGVYIHCNKKFERFFGVDESEIIGKDDYAFLDKEQAVFFRDNDRKAIESGGPRINEEWLTFVTDGYHGLFETVKAPIYDDQGNLIGVLGIARDITARKMTEEALRESEERFKALHNASFGGIAIHDKGIILECNLGLSEMFGYTRDELIGMDGLLLVAERSRDVVMSNILSGYEKPYEEYGRRKNREEFPMRLEARNLPYKGKMVRAVEFRDITDSVNAARALLAAKEAAESATQAKSVFLANMSHEVRTPLNGVLGMLQLLQTTEQTEEQKEYVLAAIKSTKRLTRLLADILDISKIESGKLQIIEAEFSTTCLQESIMEIFRPTAREKSLAFDFHVDAQMPPKLIGDETRVRQILFNLVGNAIKFTESGSVLVDAMVLPSKNGEYVRVLFAVHDTGIGISDEHLKDIFEPFVQGERSYTRCYQGAGLGLAIVRKLVKILDGEIAIDNTSSSGITVYVSLPFKLPVSHQKQAEIQPYQTNEPVETPLRILLVEDEELSLFSGKRMLHKMGYSVATALDGMEALAILHEQDFDLVLMDIQMPVMDGVEATKAIRGSSDLGEKSQIPIIAMTAYAITGDKERFLAAGMDDYISKPVDRDELKTVIERVIEKTCAANC
ncbi:PAS domain S-box protein [Solidesulfovibrio sp.]